MRTKSCNVTMQACIEKISFFFFGRLIEDGWKDGWKIEKVIFDFVNGKVY